MVETKDDGQQSNYSCYWIIRKAPRIHRNQIVSLIIESEIVALTPDNVGIGYVLSATDHHSHIPYFSTAVCRWATFSQVPLHKADQAKV